VSDNENPGAPSQTPDDLTRRQWILRLGELVALAGVSGLVPEIASSLPAAQEPARAHLTALPPGLYQPSQDHLVHALSAGGKNWTPPAGSEMEYVLPNSSPHQLQFFSEQEFQVVTRFIQILFGNIDAAPLAQAARWFDLWLFSAAGVRAAAQRLDPMHRILAVAYYGEDSVRDLETSDPQSIARAGLLALHDLAVQTHGREFLQLTESQQIELVASAGQAQPATGLRKLFDLARAQAISGYFTSAEGLKELDYRGNAYYGECPGCEGKS
jgi:hypothetical protein